MPTAPSSALVDPRLRRRTGPRLAFAALGLLAFPLAASATTVDIATPGNILAGTTASHIAVSSGPRTFAGPVTAAFDDLVGTSTQDNGQVFADGDTHQVLTVTGFNSSIGEIRFFDNTTTDPIRLPTSITIYYSTLSTLSLDPTDTAFSGPGGGVLLPTLNIPSASDAATLFPNVVSDRISWGSFFVNAPAGTQTLLVDLGSSVDRTGGTNFGDRIAELQAFAAPLPQTALAGAALLPLVPLLTRRRRRA